jgi:hypothetical protein
MNGTIHGGAQNPKCPVCNREFSHSDLVLFQESAQGCVYHATCAMCCAAVFISESVNRFGTVHVGVLTDIVAQDIARFSQNDPVCPDDVLYVYESLQDHRGGIGLLVGR